MKLMSGPFDEIRMTTQSRDKYAFPNSNKWNAANVAYHWHLLLQSSLLKRIPLLKILRISTFVSNFTLDLTGCVAL